MPKKVPVTGEFSVGFKISRVLFASWFSMDKLTNNKLSLYLSRAIFVKYCFLVTEFKLPFNLV